MGFDATKNGSPILTNVMRFGGGPTDGASERSDLFHAIPG